MKTSLTILATLMLAGIVACAAPEGYKDCEYYSQVYPYSDDPYHDVVSELARKHPTDNIGAELAAAKLASEGWSEPEIDKLLQARKKCLDYQRKSRYQTLEFIKKNVRL